MRSAPEWYWHAVPLHYLPALLESGRLLSAARLPESLRPRPSVLARRRKLGLEDFVHLSLKAVTPLLIDRLCKGRPHALLKFPAALADRPDAVYLKWNTKRWAHRDEFLPVAGTEAKAAFLTAWRGGSYPSAELLIPGALDLSLADSLIFRSDDEAALLAPLSFRDTPCMAVAPETFPSAPFAPDLAPLRAYIEACRAAGRVLPPPAPSFD